MHPKQFLGVFHRIHNPAPPQNQCEKFCNLLIFPNLIPDLQSVPFSHSGTPPLLVFCVLTPYILSRNLRFSFTGSNQVSPASPVHFSVQNRDLRLTDLTLSKLKHPGYYWDVLLPAFGVRRGKRRVCFVVVRDGRRKKLGLWPVTTLQGARKKANLWPPSHSITSTT